MTLTFLRQTCRVLLGAALAIPAAAIGFASTADAARTRVYTVSKVKVDATAADAVKAKKKAVSEGEVEAYRILLKRLTKFTDYPQLPKVLPEMADDALDNVSFLKERNSRTRYIATISYSFRPDRVKRMLKRQRVGFTDTQAPETILVTAVEKSADKAPDAGAPGGSGGQTAFSLNADKLDLGTANESLAGNNSGPAPELTWREAFTALDLRHSIAPLKLAVSPPQETAGPGDLAKRFGNERVVLATARVSEDGSRLAVKLAGTDSVGQFTSEQSYRIFDGDYRSTAELAAQVSLKIMEGRWKSARLGLGDDVDTAAQAEQVQGADKVVMTVLFSGLREWIQIRGKLENMSGVYDLEPGAVSPRGATVSLSYPGGAARLSRELARAGLVLQNTGGDWILRRR